MLALGNVEVTYLSIIRVLAGVSLEVNEGQIVALLGANGAGKSTTLKAISGLLKGEQGAVTAGSISFNGQRIDTHAAEDIGGMGIIHVMEGRRVLRHLTVEENLMVAAKGWKDLGRARRDLGMVYEYFPRLRDLRNRTSGYISGGEQQMMVIGRALMAQPKVMLLDEPSLGLAPLMVEEIFRVIRRIHEEAQKTSVLLVEQNASAALEIADYGYVMENGRVVLADSAQKLKDNQDIQQFYLGLSELGQRTSYREVKHYKRRKRWLS